MPGTVWARHRCELGGFGRCRARSSWRDLFTASPTHLSSPRHGQWSIRSRPTVVAAARQRACFQSPYGLLPTRPLPHHRSPSGTRIIDRLADRNSAHACACQTSAPDLRGFRPPLTHCRRRARNTPARARTTHAPARRRASTFRPRSSPSSRRSVPAARAAARAGRAPPGRRARRHRAGTQGGFGRHQVGSARSPGNGQDSTGRSRGPPVITGQSEPSGLAAGFGALAIDGECRRTTGRFVASTAGTRSHEGRDRVATGHHRVAATGGVNAGDRPRPADFPLHGECMNPRQDPGVERARCRKWRR